MENHPHNNRPYPDGYDPARHILVLEADNTYSLKEINIPPETNTAPRYTRRELLGRLGTIGIGALSVTGLSGAAYLTMKEAGSVESDTPNSDHEAVPTETEPTAEPDIYTVEYGDTLWDIVGTNYPNITDINTFIEQNIRNITAEENGREKHDLRPGDELIIDPAFDATPEDN